MKIPGKDNIDKASTLTQGIAGGLFIATVVLSICAPMFAGLLHALPFLHIPNMSSSTFNSILLYGQITAAATAAPAWAVMVFNNLKKQREAEERAPRLNGRVQPQ